MPTSRLGLILLCLLVGCGEDPASDSEPSAGEEEITVTAHWDETRQTLHGFGASGAWSTRFVGANWPEAKKEQIADLLFSRDTDDSGRPLGIGLSIWRFNVGAGSAEQGTDSGISDPWRRAEGFLQEDGSYDWSRQEGQQWFLRAAEERGVPTFIAFVNSPPVELTRNGKAYGDGDGDANLAPDQFDEFATFLGTVLEHFEAENLPFDYVSPVNEPQWDWSQDNGQEGSPYTNEELKQLTKVLNQELVDRSLSTRIEIPETAQIDYLYQSDTDLSQRDNQLKAFFGEAELQALPAVASKVAAHSYFTTWPVSEMIRQRERLAEARQAVDPTLDYAMSEYCVLADNEEIQGNGRALGMDPALYVARLVHFDLTVAEASSWQWWLGVSPYDYKDGLVYIDEDRHDGEVYESKLLWGLGNYSRFLQPGAVRIDVTRSDQVTDVQAAEGLMISGYQSADDEVVMVAVNRGAESRDVTLAVDGVSSDMQVEEWRPFVTSATEDLEPSALVEYGDVAEVPARSIVTFVGEVQSRQ